MSSLNKKSNVVQELTHGGTPSPRITPEMMLRRSVLSCFLWEKEFYEDGVEIAKRIVDTADRCDPDFVGRLAVQARTVYGLRHVPLLLLVSLAARPERVPGLKDFVYSTINRADEITELLAMYWKDTKGKRKPIDHQFMKGIGKSFSKFDEYQFGKYNRDGPVKLRDAIRMCHAKPSNQEQAALYTKIAKNLLSIPDTWEVALSAGKDKKETFERLIKNGDMPYMALLRNLRNMVEAGCDESLVNKTITDRKGSRYVLPFRFLMAAKHAPRFEEAIDKAFLAHCDIQDKLPGKTIVIVDLSGSMGAQLSKKADSTRMDAAIALGVIAREMCENPRVYGTAGSDRKRIHATKIIPNRHGMALVDGFKGLIGELGGGGIFTKQTLDYVQKEEGKADRIIMITDEQDTSGDRATLSVKPFGTYNYMINVASTRNGIGYHGNWTHLDGFSEALLKFIPYFEGEYLNEVK